MHETDMRSLGIADGEIVDLVGDAGDGIERQVLGFRATRYDVPRGSCAGYYPECNPLLPLWHHACAATYLPQNRSRSGFGGIRPPLRVRAPRPSTQRFGLPG